MKEQKHMVCGRFAPSPSGRMHLGNIWSALLAWLSARSAGGRMLLRLEDLDPDRCRREYCDQVMRDYEWLGLDWDGEPVYQSERSERYMQSFLALQECGLIYPCFCSRAERMAASAPHPSDGMERYPGHCRNLTEERRHALSLHRKPACRVAVPDREISFTDLVQGYYQENLRSGCGDFIVRRSDGVFAYQLAVVVDDAMMGVNQVVRGSDLLSSTPRQIWLGERLGYPRMEYAHVPLLLAKDGRRLAKRDHDQSLDSLRQRGSARELIGRLGVAAGLMEEYVPVAPGELLPLFSWEKLKPENIILPSSLGEAAK